MLDAAREAVSFASGHIRTDLDENRLLTLGLLKLIEIIGEAATQVEPETRAKAPEIPWPQIVGMRHRLVHGYFEINLDLVWDTVTNDLPPLIVALDAVVTS